MRPVFATSRTSSAVIRKPEITKKTSTPTKPPGKGPMPAWTQDDQQDGQGTEPLDVVAEATAYGLRAHGPVGRCGGHEDPHGREQVSVTLTALDGASDGVRTPDRRAPRPPGQPGPPGWASSQARVSFFGTHHPPGVDDQLTGLCRVEVGEPSRAPS